MSEQKINIDGKEYDINDLSDGAKAQLGSMQAVDLEMSRLKAQMAICQTARNAYANALQEELGQASVSE